jgi:hypothetical protein
VADQMKGTKEAGKEKKRKCTKVNELQITVE